MPIGVPRIIYCWGEELPAQWTDIYNFIFRRRMVFLMQYLDDELCNQICGLLINIHMEDRSKELEKKEMEKSGLFKTTRSSGTDTQKQNPTNLQKDLFSNTSNKLVGPSFEDLLAADEDLGIEENNTLEQFTLQKITMEWLNWNAQFFDYSDEPYLFYLAEMLSKDFSTGEARMLYSNDNNEMSILMNMFKNLSSYGVEKITLESPQYREKPKGIDQSNLSFKEKNKNHLDVYAPFRLLANFAAQDYNLKDINSHLFQNSVTSIAKFANCEGEKVTTVVETLDKKLKLLELFNTVLHNKANEINNKKISESDSTKSLSSPVEGRGVKAVSTCVSQIPVQKYSREEKGGQNKKLFAFGDDKLINSLAQKMFLEKSLNSTNLLKSTEKGLSQRLLKKEYSNDKNNSGLQYSSLYSTSKSLGVSNYLVPESVMNRASRQGTNAELAGVETVGNGGFRSTPLNYLDFYSYKDSYNEFKNARNSGNRQADKTLQEEEAKKVFLIINSFGGSVGNGITVHDALQFIKAGSLTLGLGVAASAASLALAGGTIGERYVTEGCHVMIHQPEGGIQGQASDIWIDSQEIMKIRLDVAEIYSLATYRPRHKILRDLDRDFYLTATETIHYGLADEIATNEVMHEIIEMTSKVWDYHDSKQQRLLESRESNNSGLDTQAQN